MHLDCRVVSGHKLFDGTPAGKRMLYGLQSHDLSSQETQTSSGPIASSDTFFPCGMQIEASSLFSRGGGGGSVNLVPQTLHCSAPFALKCTGRAFNPDCRQLPELFNSSLKRMTHWWDQSHGIVDATDFDNSSSCGIASHRRCYSLLMIQAQKESMGTT